MASPLYATIPDLRLVLDSTDAGTGTAAQLSDAQLTLALAAASTRVSTYTGTVFDSSTPAGPAARPDPGPGRLVGHHLLRQGQGNGRQPPGGAPLHRGRESSQRHPVRQDPARPAASRHGGHGDRACDQSAAQHLPARIQWHCVQPVRQRHRGGHYAGQLQQPVADRSRAGVPGMSGTFTGRMDLLREQTGRGELLRGSVTVDQVYAHAQHEHLEYHHPRGGSARYLSIPLFERYRRYLRTIADGVLDDGGKRGMADAMEDLSDSLMVHAPVEFWDLRRSGHPVVELGGRTIYDRSPVVHRLTDAELRAKSRL